MIFSEHAFNRVHEILNAERLSNVLNTFLREEPPRLSVNDISGYEKKTVLELRVQ